MTSREARAFFSAGATLRPSGCEDSASCFSSSSHPGGCTWPAFRPIRARLRVTQPARNLAIEGRLAEIRFLIRDRDAKFAGPLAEVLSSEGVRIIPTPLRSRRRAPLPRAA